MRNQILAAVAMAVLGACVGSFEPTPAGDDDDMPPAANPRELFDTTVSPLLAAKCQACHVGPETSATNMFLGPDGVASFYTTLVNDRAVNGGYNPAAATILLKGLHEGPAWTSDESAKISAWLQAELTAHGGTVDPGPGVNPLASARGAEMAFVGCMAAPTSLTDYTTTNAALVALLNTERGRCNSCHSPGGAGGQWLGTQNQNKDMYLKWQQEVFFTGVFQAQLQPDNTYKIGTAENKICLKGKEKTNSLGTHPTFDCKQNNGTALLNLATFTQKVWDKVVAKDPTCGPAAFAPPTI